jgi:hypothetical protein
MAGPVFGQLETAPEVIAFPPDHQQVARAVAVELIQKMERGIGIGPVPALVQPLADGSAPGTSPLKWVPGIELIRHPAS